MKGAWPSPWQKWAFAGGIGADVTGLSSLPGTSGLSDEMRLFSESPTRFLIEVEPAQASQLTTLFQGLPHIRIGSTTREPRLRIAAAPANG